MTQEEKDLLLKDLCARLPYGVKCNIGYYTPYTLLRIEIDNENGHLLDFIEDKDKFDVQCYLSEVKPYLIPLSSMSEEQEKEWQYTLSSDYNITYETVDWLNENHFDYRGLIEKSLALDATNLGIY